MAFAGAPGLSYAYSVFTHEEIVDLAWNDFVRPLLLARYPGATEKQLRDAHAYAYGGCAIQDMGYYPFGNKFFSQLTHYVRSGDFVMELLREARSLDELAFAIGALSHFAGDSIGHSEATNPSVSVHFPRLRAELGRDPTFGDAPIAHGQVEFAFDVTQLARQRYAPMEYKARIGFKVARRLLESAFRQVYGLKLGNVVGREFLSMRAYAFTITHIMPLFARAQVLKFRKQLPEEKPGEWRERFVASVAGSDYQQAGDPRSEPGFSARTAAILLHLVPKVGALKVLALKEPTPTTEGLFVKSLESAKEYFCARLSELSHGSLARGVLPNLNLDTGEAVTPGRDSLTDRTYARLLAMVTAHPGRPVPGALAENIRAFYGDKSAPIPTSHVLGELAILKP